MTDITDTNLNEAAEQAHLPHANPEDPPITSPVYQAAASVRHWLKPVDENLRLENLAIEMESALMFEDINSLSDSAVLMSTHMRILDTVFNQFIRQSLEYGRYNHIDYKKIGFALMAQRQCTNAFDKLNRRRRPKKEEQ